MEYLTVQSLFVFAMLAVGSWTAGGYMGSGLIDLGSYICKKAIMRERRLIFDAIADYEYEKNKLKYEDNWAYSYAQRYACDIVGNVIVYYRNNENRIIVKLSPDNGFEKIDN